MRRKRKTITLPKLPRTAIIKKAEGGKLGWKRVRGFVVPYSEALAVNTYFSGLIMARIHKEKPCNVIWTGEPGSSKTYSAGAFARFLQPKTFTIKNIVMTYEEFMEDMIKLRKGRIILYDEPEYGAGHRDWAQTQNKALVSTMRSGRFKVHPVFMPVINKRLLDKVIRENLIQFHVHVKERGEASVYRIKPSQFTDDTYHEYICELRIEMLDSNKCIKKWCMSCPKFGKCELLRGQYEWKRTQIQDARYEGDLLDAKQESSKISGTEVFKQNLLKASEKRGSYTVTQATKKGEKTSVSVELIELDLGCSPTQAQKIRRLINVLTREKIREFCRRGNLILPSSIV